MDWCLAFSLPGRVDGFLDAGDRPAGAGAEIDQRVRRAVDVGYVIEDALEEGGGEGRGRCGLQEGEFAGPLCG